MDPNKLPTLNANGTVVCKFLLAAAAAMLEQHGTIVIKNVKPSEKPLTVDQWQEKLAKQGGL